MHAFNEGMEIQANFMSESNACIFKMKRSFHFSRISAERPSQKPLQRGTHFHIFAAPHHISHNRLHLTYILAQEKTKVKEKKKKGGGSVAVHASDIYLM